MTKTVLLITALTVSLCGVAWGQVENELAQKSKPATTDDVTGTWKMTYQVVRPSVKTGAPLLEKGDLILSYLDPDKKPYMQRYLRKINLR